MHSNYRITKMRDKKKKHFTWKKYHRWFGLVLSVFMLVFCVSGIILNHRQLFAGCEVSRSLMPSAYHIKNFNNGIIKGSIKINHRISKIPSDSVLAYGYGGVWLTDAEMKRDYPRTWMAGISATSYRRKTEKSGVQP